MIVAEGISDTSGVSARTVVAEEEQPWFVREDSVH